MEAITKIIIVVMAITGITVVILQRQEKLVDLGIASTIALLMIFGFTLTLILKAATMVLGYKKEKKKWRRLR